jgi:hypothetical protein
MQRRETPGMISEKLCKEGEQMKLLSRYEAVRFVQEQLGKTEKAEHVIDWIKEMWETIDALYERFPECAWMIIHAQPSVAAWPKEMPQGPLIALENVALSERFAVGAAIVWYRAWLQERGESSKEVQATSLPLQHFYQRLLEVPIVLPRSGESLEDMVEERQV